MNQILACPGCNRPLRVPDSMSERTVKCPACKHVFIAPANSYEEASSPQPAPPSREESPRRPTFRYADQDGSDGWPGQQTDERPGKVQAIAIMVLVGGILATLHSVSVFGYISLLGFHTHGVGFFCCLWPGTYYALTLGIMAIIKGANLLGGRAQEQSSPMYIAIMQIVNIINLDVINLILGIVTLVFLNEPEVRWYYRR